MVDGARVCLLGSFEVELECINLALVFLCMHKFRYVNSRLWNFARLDLY